MIDCVKTLITNLLFAEQIIMMIAMKISTIPIIRRATLVEVRGSTEGLAISSLNNNN